MDIVDLKPDQIPAAGAVLARALFEDGLAKHMYPDQEERKARTPWHFSAMVRYGVLFGRQSHRSRWPGCVPRGFWVFRERHGAN